MGKWITTAMDGQMDYNRNIADNLKLAISSQGLTQTQVAKKAGITPKTLRNMLSGSARIDINLAAEIYSSLGYAPESIIKYQESRPILTGIMPVDTMLRRIYNQYAYSGVVALGEYVSDDYRCCSPQYNQWNREDFEEPFHPVLTKKADGVDLWGLSYESELRLTSENREEEIHTIEPQHATVIDEKTIGLAIIRTTIHGSNSSNGVPTGNDQRLDVKYGSDYLTLDTPVRRIVRHGDNFRITRKLWNHQTIDRLGRVEAENINQAGG